MHNIGAVTAVMVDALLKDTAGFDTGNRIKRVFEYQKTTRLHSGVEYSRVLEYSWQPLELGSGALAQKKLE